MEYYDSECTRRPTTNWVNVMIKDPWPIIIALLIAFFLGVISSGIGAVAFVATNYGQENAKIQTLETMRDSTAGAVRKALELVQLAKDDELKRPEYSLKIQSLLFQSLQLNGK